MSFIQCGSLGKRPFMLLPNYEPCGAPALGFPGPGYNRVVSGSKHFCQNQVCGSVKAGLLWRRAERFVIKQIF